VWRSISNCDLCRKVGISEASYYAWKKQYAGLGLSELPELLQLRDENGQPGDRRDVPHFGAKTGERPRFPPPARNDALLQLRIC